jgi:hypothetical protein
MSGDQSGYAAEATPRGGTRSDLQLARAEEIRVRIKTTGEPLPSKRDRAGDIIAAYFQGPERDAGGLARNAFSWLAWRSTADFGT